MKQGPSSFLVEFILDDNSSIPISIQATSQELNQLPLDLNSAWRKADLVGKNTQRPEDRAEAIGNQCLAALIKGSIS